MRRFKFRLEAVLKHRIVMEDQRMRDYAAIQNELAACEARMVGLRSEYTSTIASRLNSVDVEDASRRERYLDALTERIANEDRIREGISARLFDARLELVKARQAREAIEKVRDNDYSEYMSLSLKSEQDSLDEIATIRHRRASGATTTAS